MLSKRLRKIQWGIRHIFMISCHIYLTFLISTLRWHFLFFNIQKKERYFISHCRRRKLRKSSNILRQFQAIAILSVLLYQAMCLWSQNSKKEPFIFFKVCFPLPQCTEPYFPFLGAHAPPAGYRAEGDEDGTVRSCCVCYTFLRQQWEQYDRENKPHSQRFYWMKRLDGKPFIG